MTLDFIVVWKEKNNNEYSRRFKTYDNTVIWIRRRYSGKDRQQMYKKIYHKCDRCPFT